MIKRRLRGVILLLINTLLKGNRFWAVKRFLLNKSGCSVGKNTKIVGPIRMGVCADLFIGENCWIGENLCIYGNDRVTIGNRCDLAPNVCFATGTHIIGSHDRRAGDGYCKPITIGDGCWIGINSTFLSNVDISDGCIIAAGAVITRSFKEDCLIAGVPGKIVKTLDCGD